MRAVVFVLALTVASAAQAGNSGPKHARKANVLAAAGKCKQAIPEYNAAYALLLDPALLFNRAECLRKLGLRDQALYDYRRFLKEMPAAPNRALVESRIAALDPEARTKVAEPAAKLGVPAKEEAPAVLQTAALHAPTPAREPVAAVEEPRAPVRVAAAPSYRPAPTPAPNVMRLEDRPPPAPSSDRSTWIWMASAVVVVAAAATGAVYATSRPRTP